MKKMDGGSGAGSAGWRVIWLQVSMLTTHVVRINVITRAHFGHGLAGTGCPALSHQQEELIAQQCVAFKVGSGNAETQVPGLGGQLYLPFPAPCLHTDAPTS